MYLALMEGLGLNLPLLLQTVDNVLVAPTNLVGQTLPHDWEHVGSFLMKVQSMIRRTLTVQYFRPGFNRNTRSASGTTIRFFLS